MSLIQENFNLGSWNTMGIAAIAAEAAVVKNEDELRASLDAALPLLILGGGSNILLPDYLRKRVIINQILGWKVTNEDAQQVEINVGGGVNWHQFVTWTVDQGLGGLENLALIPGTMGAAPIQNIGAYGRELQDVFLCLDAIDLETKESVVIDGEAARFGYRNSIFKNEAKGKYFITSVTIKLNKIAHHQVHTSYKSLDQYLQNEGKVNPGVKDVFDAVVAVRQSKLPDPSEIGNTGSFFKNAIISMDQWREVSAKYPEAPSYPVNEDQVKVPTGWLIEKCGWKGKRRGDVGVYDKQALVLVNYGGGTSSDIKNLAQDIITSVHEEFGITIEPEVNFIGS